MITTGREPVVHEAAEVAAKDRFDRVLDFAVDGHAVTVFRDAGEERRLFEAGLDATGVPLPLWYRCDWAAAHRDGRWWLVGVRDRTGAPRYGLGATVTHSRAIPGHVRLRTERAGFAEAGVERDVALRATASLARRVPRVLSADIELFSRDAAARERMASILAAAGYRPVGAMRSYARTVVVDLARGEEEILASFHKTGRYNIRALERKGFSVRPVSDLKYAPRLAELVRETMARTGNRPGDDDWAAILRISKRRPDLSRIVGTFAPDSDDPSSLLAFAWGCCHGDHATYTAAASTRKIESNVSLTYTPAWEVIRWAKAVGATWFDFGGVTEGGSSDPSDPLGGISDFKRYFTTDLAVVAEEWCLEPHRLRALAAKVVGAGARWLRGRTSA